MNFLKGVAKDLCWMDNKARRKALLLVEEIIYSHAIEADSSNVAIGQWNNLQDHRKRLDDLRNTLRQETAHGKSEKKSDVIFAKKLQQKSEC